MAYRQRASVIPGARSRSSKAAESAPVLSDIVCEQMMAGPKPWRDKDDAPYQGDGDVDGDDNGSFHDDPGESPRVEPNPDPDSDSLHLRASFACAALTATDPQVSVALLAIEARLAEISLYLPQAMMGTKGDTLTKLAVLTYIL